MYIYSVATMLTILRCLSYVSLSFSLSACLPSTSQRWRLG